jgi:hypothetical protein
MRKWSGSHRATEAQRSSLFSVSPLLRVPVSGFLPIWLQASRGWCADAVQPSFGGFPGAGKAFPRFGLDIGRGTSGCAEGADAVRGHENFLGSSSFRSQVKRTMSFRGPAALPPASRPRGRRAEESTAGSREGDAAAVLNVRPRRCRTGLVRDAATGHEEAESRFLGRAQGFAVPEGSVRRSLEMTDSRCVGTSRGVLQPDPR